MVTVEELWALKKNQTWILQELPHKNKPISCKSVHHVEYNLDGSVHLFKARLVIHGDHQEEGFDYSETFAPMAKKTIVHCFLAISFSKGWDLHTVRCQQWFITW